MKQKKDLHVLYIITKLELGGAQKVCLALKNGLDASGYTSSLISGTQGSLVESANKLSQVYLLETFQHELSLFNIWSECKNFIKLIVRIKKLKKKYPHLLVHTHSTKAGIVGRWAAFFSGVKSRIHTVHGYAFHRHQNKIVWTAIYMLELITSFITTHYVCVSSEDVKTGIRLFPHFTTKHSIIRAAVDWEQFYQPARRTTPFPKNQQPFIFGTVACFKKQKNPFDLLNAFKLVQQQNPASALEIIGDGTLRPQLEAWIAQHNLKKNITLHGWQKTVAPFMMNWHAFVLSSLWEGLPCAVVEARLLKIPVLSYNTGGIHDIIIHGENGFLYEQKNIKNLSEGMLSLMLNKKLYNNLQTYNDDLSDFNNQQMVQQHISLYKKLS